MSLETSSPILCKPSIPFFDRRRYMLIPVLVLYQSETSYAGRNLHCSHWWSDVAIFQIGPCARYPSYSCQEYIPARRVMIAGPAFPACSEPLWLPQTLSCSVIPWIFRLTAASFIFPFLSHQTSFEWIKVFHGLYVTLSNRCRQLRETSAARILLTYRHSINKMMKQITAKSYEKSVLPGKTGLRYWKKGFPLLNTDWSFFAFVSVLQVRSCSRSIRVRMRRAEDWFLTMFLTTGPCQRETNQRLSFWGGDFLMCTDPILHRSSAVFLQSWPLSWRVQQGDCWPLPECPVCCPWQAAVLSVCCWDTAYFRRNGQHSCSQL